MKDLPNGHRFVSRRTPGDPFGPMKHPEEKHRPAGNGDYGCLLCGAWTTYCISQEEADKKMGPCPARIKEDT